MRISEHISYDEATTSPTALRLGIDNTPDEYKLNRMRLVAETCFEPLREWYGKPIKVNSFYRCRELNAAVKGSLTSQHILGEAIDLSAGSKSENKKLFDYIKDNLIYDQLIWEFSGVWIHVSYNKERNRKMFFSME